jgi:cold shock CspA family protein/ribosome-associated translation inhibitor RaiA
VQEWVVAVHGAVVARKNTVRAIRFPDEEGPMIRPVQITFRNIRPREAVEEAIRDRAAWLETFYPGIIGCRVLVEMPHRHRERGGHLRVLIELSLPGEDVVVSHEPTLHATLKDVEEEAHHKDDDIEAVHKYAEVAVREAFDTARRQLQDFARRQRSEVKTHEAPDHGRVAELTDDHGFIETADGRRVYFHRASVLEEGAAQVAVGSDVAFVEEPGDKGPQASTVRVLGKHHYARP